MDAKSWSRVVVVYGAFRRGMSRRFGMRGTQTVIALREARLGPIADRGKQGTRFLMFLRVFESLW